MALALNCLGSKGQKEENLLLVKTKIAFIAVCNDLYNHLIIFSRNLSEGRDCFMDTI